MKKRLFASAAIVALLCACNSEKPVETMSGFINGGSSANCIIVDNAENGAAEGAEQASFTVNDKTVFEGGSVIEGNIIEVTYNPAKGEELPVATKIVTDATYPEIIGTWATDESAEMPVMVEFQVCGKIAQTQPTEVLTFTGWQLQGEPNKITIFGTVAMPAQPEAAKKDAKAAKDEKAEAAPVEPTEFKAEAVLSNENDKKVLTVKTDDGKESKLYFVK